MPSVIKRIAAYNAKLSPQLWLMKKNAMLESPFRFFRGTAHLFAEDFGKMYGFKSKVRTWICGDMHFENFGSYKGANRQVYFDINDFDEAVLATPQPDITRFLTSIIIAGEQMEAKTKDINNAIAAVLGCYVAALAKGKSLIMERNVAHGILKKYFDQLSSRNRESFISDHTVEKKGQLHLKPDERHFLPVDEVRKKVVLKDLKALLKTNARFKHLQFEDTAFRIAGTGSLGLLRYCVLCLDKTTAKHYLIDIKQARESCFKKVISLSQPKMKNDADRIIFIEEAMQYNAPGFLASVKINNNWFVVKELQPVIDKLTIEEFKNNFSDFTDAAKEMAPLIAYAQLRSSGYHGSSTTDQLMSFASKQNWQEDILKLSAGLAAQNGLYYQQFLKGESKPQYS